MIVSPPLYLVTSKTECWKCHNTFPVAALLAPVVDEKELQGTACLLTYTAGLPDFVRDFIQTRIPTYRLKHSHTMQDAYYGNVCPNCGALSGDHYLSKPGEPFLPNTELEAERLELIEVPLPSAVEIDASYSYGSAPEMILENAKRMDAGSPEKGMQ